MTLARDAHIDAWTNRGFIRLGRRSGLWLLAVLAGTCFAGSQVTSNRPHFIVHVYNNAQLPDRVVEQAESEGGRIFSQAGVEVDWVACPLSAECRSTKGLTLNLVSKPVVESNGSSHEFGFAIHSTAWISASSLEPVVGSGLAPWSAVLGYVMAHELGHLLLGENSHSAEGVMRRRFGLPEWARVARGQMFFSTAEGEQDERPRESTPTTLIAFGGTAMSPIPLTRRGFASALLAGMPAFGQAPSGSQLGSLYPPIQAIAGASPLELSFLRPEYKDLPAWQRMARDKLLDLLQYRPERITPDVQTIAKKERDGFVEEQITFRTTPQTRVPAAVLIPTDRKPPFPGIVVLHDHGGFYLWGREKVVQTDGDPAVLADFKKQYYSGHSIANELVRRGYAVIAIDMFYWGERRFLLPDDPTAWRERPPDIGEKQVNDYNARSGQNEQLIARGLFTAGVTWPGIMLWDDMRTVDYLASRPEVDPKRLACVGLSVGGYRSFMLGALDVRMKAAVDVGWMTTFSSQIERHVIHTMGLSFVIPGMYRHFDLPDLSALIAPRGLMVQMGSKDGLFPLAGMKAAFAKIEQCYRKAGNAGGQKCKFFDVPHQFNSEMQAEAWEWLGTLV